LKGFFPTTLDHPRRLAIPRLLDSRAWPTWWSRTPSRSMRPERRVSAPRLCGSSSGWVLLRTLDPKWRDPLYEWTTSGGHRAAALAQLRPLVRYKNGGYDLFQVMMESIQSDFVRYLYHLEILGHPSTLASSWAGQVFGFLGPNGQAVHDHSSPAGPDPAHRGHAGSWAWTCGRGSPAIDRRVSYVPGELSLYGT